MIERKKRKSASSAEQYDATDETDLDEQEIMPSFKRQRITIDAMQRLFADMSISDKSDWQSSCGDSSTNKFLLPDSHNLMSDTNNNGNPTNDKNPDSSNDSSEKASEEESNNLSTVNCSSVKRNMESTTSPEFDDSANMPKPKKVRQLKRGLRLCSSITCYIEQVVY